MPQKQPPAVGIKLICTGVDLPPKHQKSIRQPEQGQIYTLRAVIETPAGHHYLLDEILNSAEGGEELSFHKNCFEIAKHTLRRRLGDSNLDASRNADQVDFFYTTSILGMPIPKAQIYWLRFSVIKIAHDVAQIMVSGSTGIGGIQVLTHVGGCVGDTLQLRPSLDNNVRATAQLKILEITQTDISFEISA